MKRNFSKKRTSVYITECLYELLQKDSENYGIPVTDIVNVALVSYYRNAEQGHHVENMSRGNP